MVEKEGEKTSSKVKVIPKKVLLEAIIKKIDYYSSKNAVSDVDLYYLIKEFFAEFLDMNYEFSLDELIFELDKIYINNSLRNETAEFIEKVKIIEYADKSFSPEYVRELVRELSLIVRKLAAVTKTDKKGFWSNFGGLFAKKKEEDTPIPRKTEESKTEIKSSVLETKAETTFSNVPDLEEDETLNFLKKYEGEQKQVTKLSDAALPDNKDENKSKRNNAKPTPDIYKKDYEKKDKKQETPSELRKSYVSNGNYDWTVDATEKKEPNKSETKELAKSENKNKKDSKKENNSNKQLETREISSEKKDSTKYKDDFQKLLDQAKATKKKADLVELYKAIHETYDSGSVDFQARYYQDILDLYTKLSNMK
ncbi:MAG: hypothetical protein ACP5N2_02365 [Candidatus Nanoarchaeia archaeon]